MRERMIGLVLRLAMAGFMRFGGFVIMRPDGYDVMYWAAEPRMRNMAESDMRIDIS